MAYEAIVSKVLKTYGIPYDRIYDVQKGYRNKIYPVQLLGGRMINVTFYKREAGIVARMQRADAVSHFLFESGFPTKKKYDSRTLELRDHRGATYVGIYTYLPGSTIPWEAYTMDHIKLLGKTMSDMHAALLHFSQPSFPSVYDEYLEIISRMSIYFSQADVIEAIHRKLAVRIDIERLEGYMRLLNEQKATLGQQILHMDFVRGNILFEDNYDEGACQLNGLSISGILDFEKTAVGHPSMDIARTLAFLLVDCKYKTPEKIRKYFLWSGYQKRGLKKDTTDPEILERLVELFLVYDLYKFLKHNPYESLRDNEHYIRTRDILNSQNVIRYG